MNKTGKIIMWSVVGLSTLGIGYYLYKMFNPKVIEIDDLNVPTPPSSGSSAPTGGGSSSIPVSNSGFPLTIGSRGELVKALQRKLNITADGIFGNQTNAAIQRAGYSVPLTEANYNKILGINQTPTTPSAPVNPNQLFSGDSIYLKDAGLAVYSYPSTNSTYLLGTIKRTDVLANRIGVYLSPAANGFSKVRLATSKGRDVSNNLRLFMGDFFVLTSKISKTPY